MLAPAHERAGAGYSEPSDGEPALGFSWTSRPVAPTRREVIVKHDQIKIRRESPVSDLASELLRRYFAELAERLPEGFDPGEKAETERVEYQAPSGVYLVVFVDDRAAGCGALRRFDAGTAEVKRMWVEPSARGHGVGHRLLEELEVLGRQLGYLALCLDTSAHLPEAIALYRSSGFEEVDDYNGNPDAAYWFRKSIG